MADRGVSHLIVVDAHSGHPSGILSALDIAAVYAT
jgi:CBS domain-containing protein